MSPPRVCLSLFGSTEEICGWIESSHADLYEIRLDLCPSEPDGAKIRATTPKSLLFTAHGRPDLLEKFWPFADYVDVEQAEATGQNTIVSVHASDQDPELLWRKLSGEHITKIVVETSDYDRIARLLNLNRINKGSGICFAAGEAGAFSRILSVFNGARWIYTSLPERPTGFGQFSLDQLIQTYRLKRFETTKPVSVFGIAGDPVSHSRSPEIQNSNFEQASLPWIYLPFPCRDIGALFLHAPKWECKGFSITHPYKEQVLALLDSVSPEVQQLRSCNTVAHVNGRWIGTNTDVEGIKALLQNVPFLRSKVAIIGAGASARAFASVIGEHTSKLFILNRNLQKANQLAQDFQAHSGLLQELKEFDYDILVQTTPVGWQGDEMPIDPSWLRPGRIVIDAIYKNTALLLKARQLGCRTINGEKWFEVQAHAQFRWWQELFTED